jgi:hypothetical protein
VNYQSANIAMEKMMASTSGTNMENKRLACFGPKLARGLILCAAVSALPGVAAARDPGFNQPGAAGNVHRDPGVNQPGAAGNVGAPGVGRDPGINQPGEAGNVHRDPGVNQPGAAGNVGEPGVGRDPGINQPGEAGNRRRVR